MLRAAILSARQFTKLVLLLSLALVCWPSELSTPPTIKLSSKKVLDKRGSVGQ